MLLALPSSPLTLTDAPTDAPIDVPPDVPLAPRPCIPCRLARCARAPRTLCAAVLPVLTARSRPACRVCTPRAPRALCAAAPSALTVRPRLARCARAPRTLCAAVLPALTVRSRPAPCLHTTRAPYTLRRRPPALTVRARRRAPAPRVPRTLCAAVVPVLTARSRPARRARALCAAVLPALTVRSRLARRARALCARLLCAAALPALTVRSRPACRACTPRAPRALCAAVLPALTVRPRPACRACTPRAPRTLCAAVLPALTVRRRRRPCPPPVHSRTVSRVVPAESVHSVPPSCPSWTVRSRLARCARRVRTLCAAALPALTARPAPPDTKYR